MAKFKKKKWNFSIFVWMTYFMCKSVKIFYIRFINGYDYLLILNIKEKNDMY